MGNLVKRTYNASINLVGGYFGAACERLSLRSPDNFPLLSQFLSRVPFAFGLKFRVAVYRRLLPTIGAEVVLHHGVVIEDIRSTFGTDIWVSVGTYIDYAHIEDHTLIGQHVVILAGKGQHRSDRIDIPIKHQGNPEKEPITIGHGAWIGANATVMADVGHDAIVGAGSVVTKPVPPFAIVAGNPARLVRMRNE